MLSCSGGGWEVEKPPEKPKFFSGPSVVTLEISLMPFTRLLHVRAYHEKLIKAGKITPKLRVQCDFSTLNKVTSSKLVLLCVERVKSELHSLLAKSIGTIPIRHYTATAVHFS